MEKTDDGLIFIYGSRGLIYMGAAKGGHLRAAVAVRRVRRRLALVPVTMAVDLERDNGEINGKRWRRG